MGIDIGRLHIRRSSLIEATPDRVWREFTSFERLAEWFGRGHDLRVYEPELGGHMELSVEVDGEDRHYGGPILAFDPGRELSFENNWHAPHAWPVATFITIRITPLYGGSHVELFHHGFERLGAEASSNLEGYESGWHPRHLEALKDIAEGR
jgi:uncharacterized protein YndB with AHSA1/START domain